MSCERLTLADRWYSTSSLSELNFTTQRKNLPLASRSTLKCCTPSPHLQTQQRRGSVSWSTGPPGRSRLGGEKGAIRGTGARYRNRTVGTETRYRNRTAGTEARYRNRTAGTETRYRNRTVGTEARYRNRTVGTEARYRKRTVGTDEGLGQRRRFNGASTMRLYSNRRRRHRKLVTRAWNFERHHKRIPRTKAHKYKHGKEPHPYAAIELRKAQVQNGRSRL